MKTYHLATLMRWVDFFQKQNKYLVARKFVEENNEAERFQGATL
jgi:hypothetical protein